MTKSQKLWIAAAAVLAVTGIAGGAAAEDCSSRSDDFAGETSNAVSVNDSHREQFATMAPGILDFAGDDFVPGEDSGRSHGRDREGRNKSDWLNNDNRIN